MTIRERWVFLQRNHCITTFNYREIPGSKYFCLFSYNSSFSSGARGDHRQALPVDKRGLLQAAQYCMQSLRYFPNLYNFFFNLKDVTQHTPFRQYIPEKFDTVKIISKLQLLVGEDRDACSQALQELSDRAPLIAYPIIRQVRCSSRLP